MAKEFHEREQAGRIFVGGGVLELGAKLGSINWQLPPGKPFDAEDLAKFLALLPRRLEGRALRASSAPGSSHWRSRAQSLARDEDVFLYFISGAKERNPQAAHALLVSLEP